MSIAGLSVRTANLNASPIREILSVIDRPGMISFAGGLPSPDSFPAIDLASVPSECLQYGPSEGEPALRAKIATELRAIGIDCTAEQVLVLSGSQQGIDLVGKLFIDPGTPVAVESPTYLAALQVFRYLGARFVARDDPNAAFAYVIPTFQNPTGECYSADDRLSLAEHCDHSMTPVFEDDPYRDLMYDRVDRTPVVASLKRAPWIYQSSFSKTFAPGIRLGFLAASPELMPYLTRLKQAADLHSNRVSQWLVLNHLSNPQRDKRSSELVAAYRGKRDAFANALDRHLGHLATWQVPAGGLFFWLTLNHHIDTQQLLPEAIRRRVAFMPGEPFYADGRASSGTLRLNFSHATTEQAEKGLRVLAEVLQTGA